MTVAPDPAPHRPLRDATPGQTLQGVYALKAAAVGTNDRGPRLSLTLADFSGTRRASLWKAPPELIAAVLVAEVVAVCGQVNATGNFQGDLTLESVRPVDPTDYPLDDLLPALPDDHPALQARLTRLIASVVDRSLSRLLSAVFTPTFREGFDSAYAAKFVHHAHRGGLLRHTVEVATLCDRACDVFPDLHRDLLLAGALLHDAGKLREMRHDLRGGEYTELGILIGHVAFGGAWILALAKGMEPSLRNHLAHLILSHHERPEHGAAREPMTPEAVVLAHADAVSAHATIGLTARAAALPGQVEVSCAGRRWCVTRPPVQAVAMMVGDSHFATATNRVAERLPVLGVAAAGIGEDNPGSVESAAPEEFRMAIPPARGADYLVRVVGDSMTGDGILDGDLVFVKQARSAPLGEIVVAWVPGSGNVVKRFGGDRLISSNSTFTPIPLTEDVVLQGCVTGVLREF